MGSPPPEPVPAETLDTLLRAFRSGSRRSDRHAGVQVPPARRRRPVQPVRLAAARRRRARRVDRGARLEHDVPRRRPRGTAVDLPRWIWEELWVVELAGDVERGPHKIRAPRGRIVGRVEGWTADTAARFAEACAWRARDRALAALERAGLEEAAARFAGAAALDDVRAATESLWETTRPASPWGWQATARRARWPGARRRASTWRPTAAP